MPAENHSLAIRACNEREGPMKRGHCIRLHLLLGLSASTNRHLSNCRHDKLAREYPAQSIRVCNKTMKYDDLPDRWKERMQSYVAERRPEGPPRLSGCDFQSKLRIDFPDGSFAEFDYAFAITMESETAVFTEHCGYHIFPSYDLVITELDR